MSGARYIALTFLVTGSALALGGLLLVIGNISNTPPLLILMIAVGVLLGFVGLMLLPFSGRRAPRGGQAVHGQRDFPQHETSTAPPASRGPTIALVTVFLIIVGLIAGFFYFVVRYLGDMTMF
jgi:hypothetical protein